MMEVSLVLGGSLKSNLRKVSVYIVSAPNFFLSVVPTSYPIYILGISTSFTYSKVGIGIGKVYT